MSKQLFKLTCLITKIKKSQNLKKITIMNNKLVLLKNYETMVEALYDQEILHENGIQSTINNEGLVELMPMFTEINDGLGLLVFDTDFEKATQLIEENNSINQQNQSNDDE